MASVHYRMLRLWSMLKKELILIKRDYITYLILIFIPFLQIIFFGFVIKTDAHHLPTIIVTYDASPITNRLIYAFKNTDYFHINDVVNDRKVAEDLMQKGKVQFIISFPQNFTHDFIRNEHPNLLIEGDGTDPVADLNAFHAATYVADNALKHDLQGPLHYLLPKASSINVLTHANYNEALLAQYHTMPGLLATLLTITLVMLTAVSISGEVEHGTMEVLLITPIHAIEIILGKIIPHIILGYILFFLSIAIIYWLFHLPFYGSFILLTLISLPYFVANLSIGLAASSFSKTQFGAANIANTYILPAVLLSGFMFPFYAMPAWAQWLGNLLPITHYMRITTSIMIKDASFAEIWPDLWPMLVFTLVVIYISLRFFRKTLD